MLSWNSEQESPSKEGEDGEAWADQGPRSGLEHWPPPKLKVPRSWQELTTEREGTLLGMLTSQALPPILKGPTKAM